jgi:hypothetical protein
MRTVAALVQRLAPDAPGPLRWNLPPERPLGKALKKGGLRLSPSTRREGSQASRAAEPYLNPREKPPQLNPIVNLTIDRFLERS